MDFPENCLRGIPSANQLDSETKVSFNLFAFRSRDTRLDGWIELSINWQDDEKALEFTLNQLKEDGSYQFGYGVAILPRLHITKVNSAIGIPDLVRYERRPIIDNDYQNPYHGNVLLQSAVGKTIKRAVADFLATGVTSLVKRV